MNIDELAAAFRGLTVDEIIDEIDRKIASCKPEDVKGITNLEALKRGFLIGFKNERKL